MVLAVDEKSQIQAWDRTRPILPMLPGTPERATHDGKRPGTSRRYAALDSLTGQVIGRLHSRHRAIEFKKVLTAIDSEVPAELDVHLVLDNSFTHKTPEIKRWLLTHPRFKLHMDVKAQSSETEGSVPQLIGTYAADAGHFHAQHVTLAGPGTGAVAFNPYMQALV